MASRTACTVQWTCQSLLFSVSYRDAAAAAQCADLAKALVELAEDARLVEHLALVAVLVVVGDALAQVARQLAVYHVLLHLLELHAHAALHHPLSHQQADKPIVHIRLRPRAGAASGKSI